MNTEKFFYWDIETAGKYATYDDFEKHDPRGAHLFLGKYNRKQKQNPNDQQWAGDVKTAYLNNASLISEFGHIVCISYAYYNEKHELKIGSISGDESVIIQKATEVFEQVAKIGKILCGYNIKNFDIPWLFKKMLSYNQSPPQNISTVNKKPWDITCVDLMEVWKSSGWESATFDEMAYALDVPSPKSEMDGTLVHSYFHTGRITEIVKYCERDVMALVDAAKKIKDLV